MSQTSETVKKLDPEAHAARSDGDAMGTPTLPTLDDSLDAVREATDAVQKHVTETYDSALSQSADFVRKNPGVALAGAVGVGLLVGLALSRRD
ncbi:MAG: hypothetical protein AAGK30_16145 [Pseudomonadota bacterium]